MATRTTAVPCHGCGETPLGRRRWRAWPAREAGEEIGIVVEADDHRCVHVMHRAAPAGDDRVGFFFEARRWRAQPRNEEPDKCSELIWVDPQALPDDVIAYPAAGVAHIGRGNVFSLHAWHDDPR
jgi:8-oxo-dGTP diphosphatase